MSEPDKFSYHEALHMSSFFARAVEEELVDHPAVQAHPEWQALAEKACEALNDLYQAIGKKED
ncbi:hypothetical protein DEA8626_01432 [Defluviimonas aquaemixtae]|uniref:Uncharacterized protein n=1 Tax=Albidovulum aquaemixtae TaxID=1542388 RepID=A0A2R8B5N5_9RHOB|nr:hypothetical protein [Defluviimonas aquaemixtae]SPH17904.1 hypothetical protein DEA8626_01432 [Defluviimonas aquaemixtae]